jgi:para-aminobenzoate synthetase component 1
MAIKERMDTKPEGSLARRNPPVIIRPIPFADPVAVFATLRGAGPAMLLDSAASGPDSGRYALVAADPAIMLEADWRDAFPRLEHLYADLPVIESPAGWPLGPGLIGAFGYELRRAVERLPSRHPREAGPADLLVGLFDTVVVFDLVDRRAAIIAADLAAGRPSPGARADRLAARLVQVSALPPVDWRAGSGWTPERSPEAYAAQVARVLDYIRAGDIYQANFTQRWLAPRPDGVDPLTLYRRLRALSPAPYAAMIEDGHGNAILSASPERFLSLSPDGTIDTRPIKGTRPRGSTPAEDQALAAQLAASAKDRAENLMIVDLLRNDLGRVAQTGSVTVPELHALHSFASVHHLVSTIRARLRPGLSPIDLLRATFPGGSVTGAPKIRAMEIIDELETARRGIYCGAIGRIGLDRSMELSIVIRTLTVTRDRVIAQAGGGIVADSDPAGEYEEALTKAWAMLGTLDAGYRKD